MKFKPELLTDKSLVVACTTPEQATQLLEWAHSQGAKWIGGETYLENLKWHKDIYYRLAKGSRGHINLIHEVTMATTVIPFDKALAKKVISLKKLYSL